MNECPARAKYTHHDQRVVRARGISPSILPRRMRLVEVARRVRSIVSVCHKLCAQRCTRKISESRATHYRFRLCRAAQQMHTFVGHPASTTSSHSPPPAPSELRSNRKRR